MNIDDILASLENPVTHDGASSTAISNLELLVRKRLPAAYIELMRRTNGVEGFLNEVNYLILWPVEDLAELNEGYGFKEFTPGLFAFGSNGGDAGYAFDTRNEDMPVAEVPFVEISLDDAKIVGANFEDFLMHLRGT